MADIIQLEENGVKQYLKTHAKAVEGLLDMIYPVGNILTSIKATNPSTYLGGTWERFAEGQTLMGVKESDPDFESVGKTGGEKTHKLTVEELPAHSFEYKTSSVNNLVRIEANSQNVYGRTGEKTAQTNTLGSDKAHNNLSPYITVYFWVRTA